MSDEIIVEEKEEDKIPPIDKTINSKLKKMFLNQYDISTQRMYEYVILKAAEMERSLDKDICNFSFEELSLFFSGLNAKSLQSIETQVSIVTNYIKTAIKNGFSKTGINFGLSFSGEDILSKYVSRSVEENKYLTTQDFIDIQEFCQNIQDYVIFELLRRGIKGDESSELVNLKISDCDFDNDMLYLTSISTIKDENGKPKISKIAKRQVVVPHSTMEIIEEAIAQEEYLKENGVMLKNKEDIPVFKMDKSEYVIKLAGREEGKNQVNKFIINSRIKKIGKWFGYDKITPTSVWVSGMIEYAKEYMREHNIIDPNKLSRQDYIAINEKYGYSGNYWFTTKTRILRYLK